MRYERGIEAKIDPERPCVAKTPAGRDRDEHAGVLCRGDRLSRAVGDLAERIQCRTVKIKGEKFYHLAKSVTSELLAIVDT